MERLCKGSVAKGSQKDTKLKTRLLRGMQDYLLILYLHYVMYHGSAGHKCMLALPRNGLIGRWELPCLGCELLEQKGGRDVRA